MPTAFFKALYRTYNQTTGATAAEEYVHSPTFEESAISCSQAQALYSGLTAQQAQALRNGCTTGAPPVPEGMTIVARNCSGGLITATDLGEYTEAPTSTNQKMPTQTYIRAANPEYFQPGVQWNNGKARIVNLATPPVDAGETARYWIGGMPYGTSLPTDYALVAGDEVQIMFVISPTPYVYQSEWVKKANALISIGPAPLN